MAIVGAERYLFTIEEFDRMYEAGIFGEDDRIEFVYGELVRMSAAGGRHSSVLTMILDAYVEVRPSGFQLSVQSPMRIAGRASFLPDLVIMRAARSRNWVPKEEEVVVLFEVSESSLNYDRNTKLPAYASANIPESWICDLVHDRLECHTEPRDGAYQQVAVAERGERIASTMIPSLIFDVDTILGPPESGDE